MLRTGKLPSRSIFHDDHGGITIFVAGAFVVIIGISALAIDMSLNFATKSNLQSTADAATTAAVPFTQDNDSDIDDIIAKAIDIARKNMSVASHGNVLVAADVAVGNWNGTAFTVGGAPETDNAVRVVTRRSAQNGNPVNSFFAGALGFGSSDISTISIAVVDPPPCILALNKTAPQALEVNSNVGLEALDCSIHVNSNDSSAIFADSNSSIDTSYICSDGGGYELRNNSHINPTPTSCAAIDDPLANHPAPADAGAGCDYHDVKLETGSETLMPGVYCGGLDINDVVIATMLPGEYIIRDSEFRVDSNATLTGDGVTIYMMDGSNLLWTSNTTISLSAPLTGPNKGMLIYTDPNNISDRHYFDSNNIAALTGVVYLPNDVLEVNSNSFVDVLQDSSHSMLIADTFKFDSNVNFIVKGDYKNSDIPLPEELLPGSRIVR